MLYIERDKRVGGFEPLMGGACVNVLVNAVGEKGSVPPLDYRREIFLDVERVT